MILDPKLLACAGAALIAHLLLGRALEQLPRRPDPPPEKIEIRVETRPPTEPAKAPEPEPPTPKPPEPKQPPPPRVVVPPRTHPRVPVPTPVPTAPVPHDTPPVDHVPTTAATTDTPVYGVTLASTSSAGSGPAVPVGNTLHPDVGTAPATTAPAPLHAPVAAYEATKMPMPQGSCSGKYTDEARAAGDEGVVVLDLTVGADGRAREIQVVSGLPHGLTEAAVAALRGCRFTPGEKDGQPVAVTIRGFQIRFVLDDP